MSNLMDYVAGGLLITTLGSMYVADERGDEIDALNTQLAVKEANVKTLDQALTKQKKLLGQYIIDLNVSMERWKNREPVVQYVDKWTTKYVTKENNATCDDVLDAISIHGF